MVFVEYRVNEASAVTTMGDVQANFEMNLESELLQLAAIIDKSREEVDDLLASLTTTTTTSVSTTVTTTTVSTTNTTHSTTSTVSDTARPMTGATAEVNFAQYHLEIVARFLRMQILATEYLLKFRYEQLHILFETCKWLLDSDSVDV